jgi:hypothetical protein
MLRLERTSKRLSKLQQTTLPEASLTERYTFRSSFSTAQKSFLQRSTRNCSFWARRSCRQMWFRIELTSYAWIPRAGRSLSS